MDSCFVIMSFHEKYVHVYKDGIRSAVERKGLQCARGDDDRLPKNIHSHIVRSLIDASLVIADLSEPSPNVFYELGISHTLGKKTIILAQDLSELPFDLGAEYSIKYSPTPDGIELLGHRLQEVIDLIQTNPESCSNLVQQAGRAHFDLQAEIRSTLAALTEDRKRLAAFQAFADRGHRTDNSSLVQALGGMISSATQSAGGKPILVGISGASAIGKTTLSGEIASYLRDTSQLSVVHLPLDAFMYDRATRLSMLVSGYDPRANDLARAEQCLLSLAAGDRVSYRPYDHSSGQHADEAITCDPGQVVIVDGIHSLSARLQRHLHMRLFIDAPAPIAKELRFIADVFERNYTITKAFQNADDEYHRYLEYIFPYSRVADLVITATGYWEYDAEIA